MIQSSVIIALGFSLALVVLLSAVWQRRRELRGLRKAFDVIGSRLSGQVFEGVFKQADQLDEPVYLGREIDLDDDLPNDLDTTSSPPVWR